MKKKMNIWESAMSMAEAPAPAAEVTLTFSPQEIDVLSEVLAQFQDKLKGMGPEDKKSYETIQKKIASRGPKPVKNDPQHRPFHPFDEN